MHLPTTLWPAGVVVRVEEAVPDQRWLRTSIALGYPADERPVRISTDLASGRAPAELPIGRRG